MNFVKFKLLMWKNYRLRRYHWVVTLIEFIIPILIASLLAWIVSSLPANTIFNNPETIFKPELKKHFVQDAKSADVYYAPNVPAIDEFMNRMKQNFRSMKGLANEAELESALQSDSSSRGIPYGIFFKYIRSNESLPDKLTYVIRNRDEWETRELYTLKETARPYIEDPYQYQYFSAIQWLINDHFVEYKTNQSVLFEVEFERFPYPSYTSDESPRSWVTLEVGFIVLIVILIASIPLINDIIDEKDSGVKELMKITGLNEWLMWFSWFFHGLIVSLISLTIVAIILTHPFGGPGSEAIYHVQFSVFWSILVFYCSANISLCFVFSAIFHKTTVATSIFLLCFVGPLFVIIVLLQYAANNPALILMSLTPVGAFCLGFSRIRYYEIHGIDFTWSSVTASENDRNSVSLMFCLLMLVFDTCLYFCLAYYITAINPGKFGARKSPFFIFKGLFSCFFTNDTQPLQNLKEEADSKFFESPPRNVEATIQIKDLHKNFGKVYAVRGVDMNIYQGEMTGLLGHNGAGKTTTMSIMTGLSSPSAGSIHFKGMDIFENMDKFRRNLGMCPQENRTIPYLTVLEHLLFFGQLKGISRAAALAEADEYLAMMEMQPKKNSLVGALSGGMKRKLCLSIALMGKAEVLILDEPTSGMDVQSRRKLWDLLLDLRGKRTVIFTTHYMEEADALGDRIAIMNHGVIVCHGTPLFLKKSYGTGYELTITKTKEGGDSAAIDSVIKAALPEASRELETPSETVYKLPLTETTKFPALFKSLEAEKLRLGIRNLGVAATTMEHVFLKVGGVSIYDSESTKHKTVTDSTSGTNYLHYMRGASLYIQQIKVLFKKKCLYTSRNLFSIFTRIILPSLVVMLVLFLVNLNRVDLSPEPPLDLSMSTYPGSTVVLKNNVRDSSFAKHLPGYVAEEGGLFVDARISPIEKDLLQYGSDIMKYNKDYISAFEVNSSTIKILHNPPLIHSLPITITTYTNVLLRSITNDSRYQINTINHPVQKKLELNHDGSETEFKNLCPSRRQSDFAFYAPWFFALAFYSIDLAAYFAVFVNTERIDGFQHIQTMSNVSPLVYWFATLLFDLTFFLFVTFLRVEVFKLADGSTFLALDASIDVFALIIIIYGISGLLFIYVTGYLSNSKEGSYVLLFIFNLICCIIVWMFFVETRENVQDPFEPVYKKMLYYLIKGVILLVPSFNFSLLFIKFMFTFQANALCSYCSEDMKPMCEKTLIKKPYFVFASEENKDAILLETLFLIFDIVLYAAILSFINIGCVRYWFNSLKNAMFGTVSTNSDVGDDDVIQEYDKVQKYKEDKSNHVSFPKREKDAINGNLLDVEISENVALRVRGQSSLLVNGLRKNYINWLKLKSFTAVSDVNFVVEPGECFGLLGVNGAGKSTTFKMLTAEIVPTLGDASIENIKLSTNKMQYLSMAGYCPQTNCFIEELTGREMLSMIATMRGVFQNENKLLVDKWIKIIGLEEFQNRRCGTYSGGNKRKLCTAMSLIGDPRVVFLDEPTSGVDPVSRRNLYDVMGQSKEAGQAVILTSHSMEECETLCDRLTIMVSGVMKCIGTAQHLKKQYAQGFSIMIKINDIPELDEEKAALKNTMLELFTEKYCILKDEHRGLLYYQIKDTSIPWWALFEKMEALKQRHRDLVEDYVLTDTTLEEVFISFAKESADPSEKNRFSAVN
ncbi:phospholipid-transporting ATPase ABCA1-like isoform X2 [Planococcus citri]|uniref:phospholipid-transporting ATPase ABCA1-like isoform X2 n=1 Tax=Planococcus citri TaxID=170843 RepID=UPI0031F9F18C